VFEMLFLLLLLLLLLLLWALTLCNCWGVAA
jgi:hypothetical protein